VLKPNLIDFLPGLLALALCGAAFRDSRVRVLLFMAALTFLLTLGVGAASEPHHLAFTLTPLVVGVTRALQLAQPLWKRLAVALVLVFLGTLALRWRTANVSPDTSFEKDRLLASLRASGLESSSVQVHASWGTYYIAHLFGDPGQAVVYLDAFGAPSGALQGVRDFASAHKRTIVLISEGKGEAARGLEGDFGRILGTQRFGDWSLVLFSGL
jgi:hypothetical protein